jgi:hypothetical protein
MIELGLSNKEIARKLRIEVERSESCPQHPRQDECAPSQSGCASRARRGWAQDEET